MSIDILINLVYIVAAVLFVSGLKMLSSPATARRGNLYSAIGMFLAVMITLVNKEVVDFQWIVIGFVIGAIIGAFAARLIAMTQMPEMVAIFNGFGGIASLLVGWGVYHSEPASNALTVTTIFLSILIGGVTFSGSLIAFGKLSEIIGGKPTLFPGQKIFNALILIAIIVAGVLFIMNPASSYDILIGIIICKNANLGKFARIKF